MIGRWLGTKPTRSGGEYSWIVNRSRDGIFTVHFRIVENGTVEDHIETGIWGVSGDIYFIVLRGRIYGDEYVPADPTDGYNYDAYKILAQSELEFEYQHATTGNRFKLSKVPDDFEFPAIEEESFDLPELPQDI